MNERSYFKSFYFLYFAAWSGFVVFRNAYFEESGLTGVEMGTIGFLLRTAGIAALPAWGLLSDRFGAQKRILFVSVIGAGALGLLYPRAAAVFPLVALVIVAFAALQAPIRPVANSMLLSAGLSYGNIRAYGSGAFGVAALGAACSAPGSGLSSSSTCSASAWRCSRSYCSGSRLRANHQRRASASVRRRS